MVEIKKEDIGKRVICGIYLQEKKYGVIELFTEDKIFVRTEPYGKVIQYNYEDVDLDFQPGDGFATNMEEEWAIFSGQKQRKND